MSKKSPARAPDASKSPAASWAALEQQVVAKFGPDIFEKLKAGREAEAAGPHARVVADVHSYLQTASLFELNPRRKGSSLVFNPPSPRSRGFVTDGDAWSAEFARRLCDAWKRLDAAAATLDSQWNAEQPNWARLSARVGGAGIVSFADAVERAELAAQPAVAPAAPGRRSAPMSKAQLAARILNKAKARGRDLKSFEGFDLRQLQGTNRFTVGLDAPAVDAAMRARLEQPAE